MLIEGGFQIHLPTLGGQVGELDDMAGRTGAIFWTEALTL
jgi:hypothetical protein